MKRTQIYLEESQKNELDLLAKQKGVSVSEVIREAVSVYIVDSKKNLENRILETRGLWKNRSDIDDSVDYVNQLRNEMNNHRREK